MKNVGWLLAKNILNSTFDSATPKLENAASHRQSRTYGPLLSFILTSLLSNSVIAKYAPFDFFKVTYDPSPWVAYNRPTQAVYNSHHSYDNSWKPINNPELEYGPPQYITEHPVTELPPPASTEPTHVHHHHHFSRPGQQQIVNIYESDNKPTEIIIEQPPDDEQEEGTSEISTNLEPPRDVQEEPVPQQSELVAKKQVKRWIPYQYANNRRTRPRRKYTTTPDYYYDSYEDFSTLRIRSKKKNKRRPQNSYEDDEYDYDSLEYTTKPYRKRKKPTQRRKNKYKNKKRQETTTADYEEYEDANAEQVTLGLRPRQETTTTSTSTTTETTSTSTTTTPSTTITVGSTSAPAPSNVSGYGYGPSNGHEGVSFTYGPPQRPIQPVYGPPRPSYGAPLSSYYNPFADWRSQQQTRNSIVKKVHNIVGFDDDIQSFT